MNLTIFGCDAEEAKRFGERAGDYGIVPIFVEAPLSIYNARFVANSPCISVNHKSVVTAAMLKLLQRRGVKYISTRSIGLDHIDLEMAEQLGIEVQPLCYSPDSVADFTLMLMLMQLRNAPSLLRRAARQDFRLEAVRGREMRDLTVGIIGTGRIGQAVIQRLGNFGCRIFAYDCKLHHATANVPYVQLEYLLQQCDIISLHMPLTAETTHFLNPERIGLIKEGSILINTSRGGLIDTTALVQALESGKLAGAALDVLEGEEGIFYHDCAGREVHHPLLKRLQELPNVSITPHTAFYTEHALCDVVENTLANCWNYQGGKQRCVR